MARAIVTASKKLFVCTFSKYSMNSLGAPILPPNDQGWIFPSDVDVTGIVNHFSASPVRLVYIKLIKSISSFWQLHNEKPACQARRLNTALRIPSGTMVSLWKKKYQSAMALALGFGPGTCVAYFVFGDLRNMNRVHWLTNFTAYMCSFVHSRHHKLCNFTQAVQNLHQCLSLTIDFLRDNHLGVTDGQPLARTHRYWNLIEMSSYVHNLTRPSLLTSEIVQSITTFDVASSLHSSWNGKRR